MSENDASEPTTRPAVVPICGPMCAPMCAIGASAGGVEALDTFFDAVASDLGFADVVVIHLARSLTRPELAVIAKDVVPGEAAEGWLAVEGGLTEARIKLRDQTERFLFSGLHLIEEPTARLVHVVAVLPAISLTAEIRVPNAHLGEG